MKAACPYCGRTISVDAGRYILHSVHSKQMNTCPLSNQKHCPTGMSDEDMEQRAKFVVYLAQQVQDEDPGLVWLHLTGLPADELQRLLMVALAGIPLDKTLHQIFSWVLELPAARCAA